MNTRTMVITASVTAIALAGVTGFTVANAATQQKDGGLVQAIASKFNLKTTDVQKVFDEQHQKREAEMETKVKDELATLVKDGKLTQAQADALTAKRAEVKKNMESERDTMKSKTAAERKQAMEQKRTDLDTWAKQQNISTEYLRFVMGGGRGGHGHGMKGDAAPAAPANQ
jgi:hypothetical protein